MKKFTDLAVYFYYPLVDADQVLSEKSRKLIEEIEEEIDLDREEFDDEESYQIALKLEILTSLNITEVRGITNSMNAMFGTKYKITKKGKEFILIN